MYDTIIDSHFIGHPRTRKCYQFIKDQHYGVTQLDVEAFQQLCTECDKLVALRVV